MMSRGRIKEEVQVCSNLEAKSLENFRVNLSRAGQRMLDPLGIRYTLKHTPF